MQTIKVILTSACIILAVILVIVSPYIALGLVFAFIAIMVFMSVKSLTQWRSKWKH